MSDDTDSLATTSERRPIDQSRRTVLKFTGAGAALSLLSAQTTAAISDHDTEPDHDDEDDDYDDVEELRLVGEVPVETANFVDVQGDYAYVSTWSGFAVIDAHDPARPCKVAEVTVPGVGVHENYLQVDCDLLAVASQGHGLARFFGIDESELHEVDPDEFGVQFYDVSDPTSPEHLGTWQEPPAGIHNLALDGNYAYLCRAFPFEDSLLRIVDVSDPTDPTEVATWRVEDEHPDLDQPVNFPHGVTVQNDFAYLAYWDAFGRILDVSDPSNPVEVSSFGEAPDATEPVEGDFDKLFEEPESEFAQRMSSLPGNAHLAVPSPDGRYVYVSEETFAGEPGGIRVFDVTDFDDPVELTRIDPPSDRGSEFAHFHDVTPDRLHSSWMDGGVRVFDISDPENPKELARYAPEGFHSENSVSQFSFTISTFGGAGVVFLHPDLGEQRAPTIGAHGDDLDHGDDDHDEDS